MASYSAIADFVAPMMRKLGGWVSHAAGALNPVDLAASTGWKKMRADIGTNNPFAIGGAAVSFARQGAAEFAAARAANPAIKPYGISSWFRGATYNDQIGMAGGAAASSSMMKAMQNRAIVRGGVTAAIAGPMLFGEDSFPGRITRTARSVGIHAAAAVALTPISPLAGAMYAGFAGMNMLRRGDNVGPF